MNRETHAAVGTSGVGRRDFVKLGAAAGALTMLNACAGPAPPAAPPPAAGGAAAAQDAEKVIWESPQSKRPNISVDVHAHWTPEPYAKAVRQIRRGGGGDDDIEPLMEDLTTKIKMMDEKSVQTPILTHGGGKPWSWLSPEESAHLVTLSNDAGLEAHKAFPDRFVLGAEIPAMDPALALKEVNRMAGKPGVVGLHLPPTMIFKDYIFDPAFAPVLARAEQLRWPLLLHPLDGAVHEFGGTQSRIGEPLTSDTFIYNTLGFPMDTGTTAALFIVTGTLDKYPNLQVVLPHAGGNFPYIAGRIEHGITRRKFPLKRPFREYFRQFHYDTMAYYPETMRFLIEFAGVDHIMIGTDHGYTRSPNDRSDAGGRRQNVYEWPHWLVEAMKLPKDQEEMILRGNAAKLFRL